MEKSNLEKALEVYEKLLKGVSSQYKFLFGKETDEWLRKRFAESDALCQDMLQDGKNLTVCGEYVTDLAKKKANKQSGVCIDNETVFEWIEDYIHRDEAAIKAQKQKEKEEREVKKKEAEAKRKEKENQTQSEKVQERVKERLEKIEKKKAEEKPVEKPKAEPKKPKKSEADGQMSLFDFM